MGSTHKKKLFYAIPKGICYRLASLISFNETNLMKMLDQLHLVHVKALQIAGLMKDNDFSKLIDCVLTTTKPIDASSTNLDNNTSIISSSFNPSVRNTHMTIGFCKL